MALHAYVVTHFLTHGGIVYGGTVICIGGGGGRNPQLVFDSMFLHVIQLWRSSDGLSPRDLNYNDLQEFPMAIRTLGKLQEL